MRSHIRKIIFRSIKVSLLSLFIVFAMARIALQLDFLNPVTRAISNFSFSDLYFQIYSETEKQNSDITIIDLTKVYDRSRIARTIREVTMCSPEIAAFDVTFPAYKAAPELNDTLFEAISELNNVCKERNKDKDKNYVIVACKLRKGNQKTGEYQKIEHSFFMPNEYIIEAPSNSEEVSAEQNTRHTYAWFTHNGDTLRSLPYAIACARAPQIENTYKNKRKFFINYSYTRFNIIPYDSIVQHKRDITDHIVIFGAISDPTDMKYTPHGLLSGTIVQAYSVQTYLDYYNVYALHPIWVFIISLLLVIFTDMLQVSFKTWGASRDSILISRLSQSVFVLHIINFIWLSILIGIGYILFFEMSRHIFIDLRFAMGGIAMLVESRLLYETISLIIKDYKNKYKQKKNA